MAKKQPERHFEDWIPSDWTDWAPDPGEVEKLAREKPGEVRVWTDEELDALLKPKPKRKH